MKGDALRALRGQLRLTQVELARRLGVHWNTVARYERDEIAIPEPTARLLRLLARERTSGEPTGPGVRERRRARGAHPLDRARHRQDGETRAAEARPPLVPAVRATKPADLQVERRRRTDRG